MSAGGKTYAEVVEQALAQERIEQASIQNREVQKGNSTRSGSGQNRFFRKPGTSASGMGQTSRFGPTSSGQKRKFEGSRFSGQSPSQLSTSTRSQSFRSGVSCYNCGQQGHMKGQCPTVKCIKCGRLGHSDRFCPGQSSGIRSAQG